VKLLKCVVVGGLLVSANQAFAEDDPAAELRLLKTKLKQLEQRVDDQGRKEKKIEAQADALGQVPPLYKAQPSCPFGKLCYKGITLTFGGWVDLTDIYRTRNLASDTGSIYNSIPFAQSKNFFVPESRFSARQTRFSVLAEGNVGSDTRVAGYGEIDFEGAAQTANSVATNSFQSADASAQPDAGSDRSRLSRSRRTVMVAQRPQQGRHRPARRRCARRDRFRIRPRIFGGQATGHPRLAGHRAGVQDRGIGRKCADVLFRRQYAGRRDARRRSAGRAEPEPAREPDRSWWELLQQRQ